MYKEKQIEAIKEVVNKFNSLILNGNEAIMEIYDILGMNNMDKLLKKTQKECGILDFDSFLKEEE